MKGAVMGDWDWRGELPGYHRSHKELRIRGGGLAKLEPGDTLFVDIKDGRVRFTRMGPSSEMQHLDVIEKMPARDRPDDILFAPWLHGNVDGPDIVATLVELSTGYRCRVIRERKEEFVMFEIVALD